MKRFHWVVCQLDELKRCLNINAIRSALKNLPKTLNETYARILMNIDEEYRENALRVLQWLVFSAVPLRIDEIAEILIAKPDSDSKVDIEERLFDPYDILIYFGALVTIQEPSGRELVSDAPTAANTSRELRLAHFSVQEYLISQCILSRGPEYGICETAANFSMAGTCLTYLFQFANLRSLPIDTLNSYPLAGYAAQYWAEHARKAGPEIGSRGLDRRVVRVLDHEQFRTNWIQLYDPDAGWEEPQLEEQTRISATPLYYTCLLGLPGPAQILLKEGADVNAQGGYYGNALQAASAGGHEAIVKLLLEQGADVNVQGGGYYDNALQAASAGGHEAIVKLLLEQGADVNVQGGGYYGNALKAASAGGYEEIVMLLLNCGADVNAQGGDYYGTPLQAASAGAYEKIVMLLLQNGADVEAMGGICGNALQVASARGYDEVVRLLVQSGADVNAQGGYYGSALQAASARGYDTVVRLLVQSGADVNAEGGYYGSALQAASARGYDTAVRLLVESGADFNAQGGKYSQTILHAA
jgi:ankyrin repeat protein